MYVRKNAANLTGEEWRRLMEAIVKLKHMFSAGSNVSVYDQFVAIHPGVVQLTGAQTGNGAHNAAAFLPWHREYLRRYENALQSVDPRVTLPYVNWGLGDVSETTALFQDDRMGPMGSGGTGSDVATGYLALNPNAFNPHDDRARRPGARCRSQRRSATDSQCRPPWSASRRRPTATYGH